MCKCQVMPRLLCHEVCLGAGCLVNCRGKWRRGVVIKFTKSNYEVRLIDTGEHETISLKSVSLILQKKRQHKVHVNLFVTA